MRGQVVTFRGTREDATSQSYPGRAAVSPPRSGGGKVCVYSRGVSLLQRPKMVFLLDGGAILPIHEVKEVDQRIIGICLGALLTLVFFTFVVLSAP
jgi:hypothetical protein